MNIKQQITKRVEEFTRFNRSLVQKYNPKENNNFGPYHLHINMVNDLIFFIRKPNG